MTGSYMSMMIFHNNCFCDFSYIFNYVYFLCALIINHQIVFNIILSLTVSFSGTLLTLASFFGKIYVKIYTVSIVCLW